MLTPGVCNTNIIHGILECVNHKKRACWPFSSGYEFQNPLYRCGRLLIFKHNDITFLLQTNLL